MAEGLKIQIGADVAGALQGMTAVEQRTIQLQKSIERLQKIIGSTNSPQQLSSALAALSKRQSELNKIVSAAPAGFGNLSKSSNQATLALSNLGRVAQDAPFGFIGIANNLNPLLESFQRLKASTGTTGGALKALTGALKGPAGIGIALSVVSSLAVVFGDKLFGLSKAAKAAKKETNKLAESVSQDLVKLTSLVGIVQNLNSSNEDRAKALKAINEQYGKYLPSLGIEEITAGNIAIAYDKITESLLRQAVVKGLQAEIQKEVEETAAKIINLTKQQERSRLESQNSVKPVYEKISADKVLQRTQDGLTKSTTDGYLAQQKQIQTTKAQIGTTNVLGQVINKLKDDLKETLKPLLNLTTSFDDLDISLKTDKVKVDKLKVVPKKLELDFSNIANTELDFTIPPDEVKPVATEFGTMFKKDLENYFKRTEPIDFGLISALTATESDAEKAAKKIAQVVNDGLQSGISSSISGFAEGLGDALVSGDISNAFKGFASAIGSALQEMGRQIIAIGVAALAAKDALKKLFLNPGLAIIAGAGLVVAGAALQSALSKDFGGFRAGGGPVSSGLAYVVGEDGPEIFRPSVSGSIIPNNQIGGFSGRPSFSSGSQRQIVRGQNIILASARTTRGNSRLGNG